MLPTTPGQLVTLALTALSVAGATRVARQRHRPGFSRAAHALMSVTMIAMFVAPGVATGIGVLTATGGAAWLVSRSLGRSPDALPCLLDLIGMVVVAALLLIAMADPPATTHHNGGQPPLVVALGLQAAGAWAAAAVWLRKNPGVFLRSSPQVQVHGRVSSTESRPHRPRVAQVAAASAFRPTSTAASLASIAAMAAMVLTHT